MPLTFPCSAALGLALFVASAFSSPYNQTYIDSVPIQEDADLAAAAIVLDHYMQAGVRQDPRLAAQLITEYLRDQSQAVHRTQKVFLRNDELFSSYQSITSDIYGYEVKQSLFGPTLELEGRVETTQGFSHEFSATLLMQNKRWMIHQISFNRCRKGRNL